MTAKRVASTRDLVPGFGAALKARRAALGLSLPKLGEMTGIHFTYISKLENNTNSPSLRVAAELATALGVTLDFLMQQAALLAPKGEDSRKPKIEGEES